MEMGMNRGVATLAVPFMWVTPGGSDPFSPTVIMIVNAAQARMRELGYKVTGHGFAGKTTQAAFAAVSGPDWKNKSWIQIYGDLLTASKAGRRNSVPMGDFMYTQGLGNYSQALGAIGVTGWCSDKNPQPPCKPRGGSCIPKNAATLASFKAAQNAINRILKAKSKGGYISVDGRPGPGTLRALDKARVAAGLPAGQALGPFSHCDQFAAVADVIAITLGSLADQLGAPKSVKPAVSFSAPSTPRPDGSVYNPPMTAGIGELVSTPLGMGLVAAGVFGLLYFRGGKKKPKKNPGRKRTRRYVSLATRRRRHLATVARKVGKPASRVTNRDIFRAIEGGGAAGKSAAWLLNRQGRG